MPPKRAPKAPPAPTHSPAKKAPRPASTKKKQAPPKSTQPANQRPKRAPKEVSQQLSVLLRDLSVSANTIVDFIVGPTCGLESRHSPYFSFPNCGTPPNTTPFLIAVAANRLDVAKLLAEHSANTKAVAEDKLTALHIASQFGHLEMMRYLVEQCGMEVQITDKYGRTSLHLALSNKHSDAALLLLEFGADPSQSNIQGLTALHVACIFGVVDLVQVLIEKGASRDAVNKEGSTPFDLAVECQQREVVALLGARP